MKIKDLPKNHRSTARHMINELKNNPEQMLIFYKEGLSENLVFSSKEEYEKLNKHFDVVIVEKLKRVNFKDIHKRKK